MFKYTMKLIWFCMLGIGLINAAPTQHKARGDTRNNCGYQACRPTNSSVLNVHIVPHSHDDVGWLKTVDQYYFGSRTNIQRAGVQYIIDSVVTALLQNPERRFIQVESAFYQKWWSTQSEERRDAFRQLVNNGQLEIIGGAWSMNDEAAVHYQSIIDQFTFGLRFVNDTLGECGRTRIGWQIDPFGHSREMASIFSQMGYDGLFFARLDWRDRSTRLTSKTAEMLWQGSSNLGDSSNLFTSILYNHYSAPSGYCFDVLCSDDPIIDDINSTEYNYEQKIEGFAEFIKRQAQYYKTSNIIITMGDDFNYQDALSYYKNLDKLIEGFNKFEQYYEDKRINVFYSTPTCYVKAVHDEAESRDLDFRLKTDDFFPYASDYHAYWTGYYTSRPTSKRFERQGNNLLQVAKQISSFVNHNEGKLHELQDAMGIMQHHDAITGTEKQHVADDYARIVTSAVKDTVDHVNDVFLVLLPKDGGAKEDLNFDSCLLANVSICTTSQSGSFIASVYNPLSRPVTYYVRLPVDSIAYSIIGPNDETIPFQLLKSIDSFSHLSGSHPAPYELVFAAELPALGAKLFNVIRTAINPAANVIPDTSSRRFKIGTETAGFELNPTSGLLQTVTIDGRTLDVKQELMYYIGSRGNNQGFENRASGAYIFRPSSTHPNALAFTPNVSTATYRGLLVEEVHQTFGDWAKQIIRVYKDTSYIEFDWLVGPIYTDDDQGREVISRFTSTLNSGDEFYTDSNGREMLKRKLKFRPTFSYSDEEPVAGNYYPITSKIVLKDEESNLEIAVLNDRAQGGTSLRSGELELMLHRRLLDDDAFGVGEALNEVQFGRGLIARGQHYLTFGVSTSIEGKTSAAVQKDIAQKKLLEPWVFLSPYTSFWENINHEILGLSRSLQDNVQILTLEPWKSSENTLLLRLEHVFEQYEDLVLSENVTVDLNGLFTYFDVISVQEMTLGANQLLSENERLNWIVGEPLENPALENLTGRKYEHVRNVQEPTDLLITLAPMQIRTFLLNVNFNNV